jgi:hypothetical protein
MMRKGIVNRFGSLFLVMIFGVVFSLGSVLLPSSLGLNTAGAQTVNCVSAGVSFQCAGGTGTSSDPYKFNTGAQLYSLALANLNNNDAYTNSDNVTYNKYFELTADIDLNAYSSWLPLGTESANREFAGYFDGKGYKINNLHVNDKNSNCNAVILCGAQYGLFGFVQGGKIVPSIQNIVLNSGNADNTGAGKAQYVSTLIGDVEGAAKIQNIINKINVTTTNDDAGGVIGHAYAGTTASTYRTITLDNVVNQGNVTVKTTASKAAGIIGNTLTISKGIINIINSHNTGKITGYSFAAGIAGASMTAINISNCYNTGAVSGYSSIGGIIDNLGQLSEQNTAVTKSYNTGAISGSKTGIVKAGGIVGDISNYGSSSVVTVSDVYNTGKITGNHSGDNLGGIVGEIASSSSGTTANVTRTVNYGSIQSIATSAPNIGGIIGSIDSWGSGSSIVSNSVAMNNYIKIGQSVRNININRIIGEIHIWSSGYAEPKVSKIYASTGSKAYSKSNRLISWGTTTSNNNGADLSPFNFSTATTSSILGSNWKSSCTDTKLICFPVLKVSTPQPQLKVFTKNLPIVNSKTPKWADMSGHGASDKAAINWLYKYNVTTGIKVGKKLNYNPSGNVTRLQMALFLYRLAGKPSISGMISAKSVFTDLSKHGADDVAAVTWMVNRGITTGLTNTTYNPNGFVTRQQMALFMYRLGGLTGSTSYSKFTDIKKLDKNSQKAIKWMAANKITTGVDPKGKKYAPINLVSRLQMALFIERLSANILTKKK